MSDIKADLRRQKLYDQDGKPVPNPMCVAAADHIAQLEAEVVRFRNFADRQRELLQQLNAMFGGPEVGSFDQFVEKMRVEKRYATDAYNDLRIAAENFVLAREEPNATETDLENTWRVLKEALEALRAREAEAVPEIDGRTGKITDPPPVEPLSEESKAKVTAEVERLREVSGPLSGKYGVVLEPFVRRMEAELHANSIKGGREEWLAMDRNATLLEIFYHLSKMQKAVKDGDRARIYEYGADVANMAMMLVDICGAWPAREALTKGAGR